MTDGFLELNADRVEVGVGRGDVAVAEQRPDMMEGHAGLMPPAASFVPEVVEMQIDLPVDNPHLSRELAAGAVPCRLCQLNEGGAKFGVEKPARASSAGTRHRLPREERLRTQQSVVSCAKQMSTDSEQILDDAVHRCETL